MRRASLFRGRVTAVTCAQPATPHHTSSLRFSSVSQLSYNRRGAAASPRRCSSLKHPSNAKHEAGLPHSPARPLKSNPPRAQERRGDAVPASSHSQGDPSPRRSSFCTTRSSEGAASGVRGRKVSYLLETRLGKDERKRTACLGCQVRAKTSFEAPPGPPAWCFPPTPSNAGLPK